MRRILRVAKTAVVLTIVFMMTVDTANACRLFQWLFAHRGACQVSKAQSCGIQLATAPVALSPVYSAPVYSDPVYSAPVYSDPVIESAPIYSSPISYDSGISLGSEVMSSDCCCCGGSGGGIVDSYPVDSGFVDSGYSDSGVVDGGYVSDGFIDGGYMDGAVVDGNYADFPVTGEVIMDASPVDAAQVDSVVMPSVVDDGGTVVAPIPDSSFDSGTPVAADPPADNPLVAPVDPPAGDAGGDDAFGAPAGDAGGDDAFGAPAGDAGGDDAFGAPAGDAGGDDAFGAPAGDAGGDDAFGAPAGDAGGDDAFGAGTDDLFDEAGSDAAGGDDLFDDGASNSNVGETVVASNEVSNDSPADDFNLVEEAPAVETSNTSEEAVDQTTDTLDDLFSKQLPNGMRVWTDDTGKYETIGRLVVIAKTHVRLLKENGRYSTVPLNRLSGTDLDYVMAVAKKLSSDSPRIASR